MLVMNVLAIQRPKCIYGVPSPGVLKSRGAMVIPPSEGVGRTLLFVWLNVNPDDVIIIDVEYKGLEARNQKP